MKYSVMFSPVQLVSCTPHLVHYIHCRLPLLCTSCCMLTALLVRLQTAFCCLAPAHVSTNMKAQSDLTSHTEKLFALTAPCVSGGAQSRSAAMETVSSLPPSGVIKQKRVVPVVVRARMLPQAVPEANATFCPGRRPP